MENWWETWKLGCPVYSPPYHDLHAQLEMFEPFWGWDGTSTCCVDQVFLTHSPLAQRVRKLLQRSLPLALGNFYFQLAGEAYSGVMQDLLSWTTLLSMAVPGQQCLCMAEQPLSENWGKKKNLSCRSGVNVQNYCISSLMDLLLQNE